MAQTRDGAIKIAARKAGLSAQAYLHNISVGLKWCSKGHHWCPKEDFHSDQSRYDGLSAHCKSCLRTGNPVGWHARPAINPLTGRPGPAPKPARDGDMIQARQRINVEVRTGHRAHPSTLPCTDCSHIGKGRKHEYDHHLGYAGKHHLDVEPVCVLCHAKRESSRGKRERVRDNTGKYRRSANG